MATILILGSVNWGVIGWVALGTIILVILVAAVGRGILVAFPPKSEYTSSFASKKTAKAARKVVPAAGVPAISVEYKNISAETLAAISAAVSVVLRGKKFALKSVSPAAAVPAQNGAPAPAKISSEWAMEGRREVYASHAIR